MNPVEEFLGHLNPMQREAVETIDGPLLIVAGAGTGKTRVITYRVAHMLRHCGVNPWNILAVTFTNKAAGEMRRRVVELVGADPGVSLQMSTFHSACARLLRREAHQLGMSSSFTICDESDQKAVVKDCLSQLDIAADDLHPNYALHHISGAKMRLLSPEDLADGAETERDQQIAEVYARYQKRLRENDAMDFDDLLNNAIRVFEESAETLDEYRRRWRYVLVDEYQDTNHAQYKLVELLAREHRNLCVVGDEDQSIYSWRGAEISNLLDFQQHFSEARIVRLEQNYRSTQPILSVANCVIENNQERLGKNLWTERQSGPKPIARVLADGRQEAAWVADRVLYHQANGYRLEDMAVFYRANSLSRPFEDELRRLNIPYRVVGGMRFYDRMEVKDLIAYLNLIENPNNSIAFMRVVNRPRRGVGEKSLTTLQNFADRHGLSCYAAIPRGAESGELGRAAKRFVEFHALVERWRDLKNQNTSLCDLFGAVLKDTEYEDKLGDPKDLQVAARKENIAELANVIREYEKENRNGGLGDFLEMVSLQSGADETVEDDSLSLMSLHAAKGLEFRVVFLVALEDPIFPNKQAVESANSDEEERRLFYVGVTRAEDQLYLSRAESRFRFGQQMFNKCSKFLLEIPPEMIEEDDGEMDSPFPAGFRPDGAGWDFGRRGYGRGAAGSGSRSRSKPIRRESVFDKRKSSAGAGAGGASGAGSGKFHKGQRVRHALFGEGVVEHVVKSSTKGATIVVQFDDGEVRALIEKMSKLEVVKE